MRVRRPKYPNWDVLRLLAALTVVIGVHWEASAWGLPLRYRAFIPFDAVPVFVCLSGVLIPASLETSIKDYGGDAWKNFAWKRFLRVYPALVASLILCLLLFGPTVLWPTLLGYLTVGIISAAASVNGALWSLSLEELLYGWQVVSRLKNLAGKWTSLVCLIACVALWFPFRYDTAANNILRAAASFFVGTLIYYSLPKLARIPGSWLLATWLLIRVTVFVFFSDITVSHVQSIVVSPVSAALIVLGLRNIRQLAWHFPDISYGVYVYHVPLLLFGVKVFRLAPVPLLIWTLTSTVVVSALSWLLIERRALQLKGAFKPKAEKSSLRQAADHEQSEGAEVRLQA